MGRGLVLIAALLVVVLPPTVRPLRAQTEIGADLGIFSSYLWRGLTRTNKPVLQPAAYLSIPAGNASITFGGWSNIEIGRYDDRTDDVSESGGSSILNLAEFEPYAEISFPVGRATLTGGVIGYLYPNDQNAPNSFGLLTSISNSVELYGKMGLDAPLSPELSVYYDFDKVDGAYIEGSVSYSLAAANERISLDLGALAGFSAGQGIPEFVIPGDGEGSNDFGNFADDGLTHVDVSAAIPFTAGALSITPLVHLVFAIDDFAKFTSPTTASDVKLWGGVSLSWSRALGGEPETGDELQPYIRGPPRPAARTH